MDEQRTAQTRSTFPGEGLRVLRYLLVGLCVAGAHFAIAWGLALFGVWPGLANAIGHVCGFGLSYWGQSRMTFGLARGSGTMLARWAGVQIVLLITSSLGVEFAVDLGARPVFAIAGAVAAVAASGYLAGRLWVFRQH